MSMHKKNLSKFINSLFFIGAITFSSLCSAQINTEQFVNQSQAIIKATLGNFKKDINAPLAARMFDIGDPMYYNFLSGGTAQRSYKNDHLGLVYFDNKHNQFKIDNQPTSYCFILYNSKDKAFLTNYMELNIFTWQTLVYYLNYHELGHCFNSFQEEHNPEKHVGSPQLTESLADMFAIAMFLNHDNDTEAQAVIKLNHKIKPGDIHYNPVLLEQFYQRYKALNFHSTHVKEIFEKTYELFNQLHPFS